MYKTIRHGENSLQYTILPQHDDYSKGVGGSGGAGGQSSLAPEALGIGAGGVTIVRKKKRSWMAYVGLLFVCSIITGAILVPLLVSVEVLSGPKEWFYRHTGQRLGVYNKPSSNTAKVLASGDVSSAYRHDPKPIQVNRTDTTKVAVLVPILGDAFSDEEENTNEETTTQINRLSSNQQPSMMVFVVSTTTSPINLVSGDLSEPPSKITDSKQSTIDDYNSTPLLLVNTSPQPTVTHDVPPTTGRKLEKPKISRPNLTPVVAPTLSLANASETATPSSVVSTSSFIPKRNWIDTHKWNSYNTTVPVYNSSVQPLAILCSAIAGMFLTMVCFLLIKRCTANKQKRVDLLTVEAQNGDNTTLLTNEEEEDEMTEEE